ncbi:MAG TPA: DUF2970 domain-containing protein [Burkholderiales bacterium]|nr:DUF2970 domain-containing protein [Burkholderiales bacterium]
MSDAMRPGLLDVVKTVLFGALGVRRKADHERQTQPVNPVYLIVAGVVFAALFVLTLIVIVRIVVS